MKELDSKFERFNSEINSSEFRKLNEYELCEILELIIKELKTHDRKITNLFKVKPHSLARCK
jgi:hypothetical protein